MSRNVERSYIVQHRPMGVGLGVVPTHFAPGYTNAHKATRKEAIEYAIQSKKDTIEKEMSDIHELVNLSLLEVNKE